MAITGREFELEQKRLKEVSFLLNDTLESLNVKLNADQLAMQDFRRFNWENKHEIRKGDDFAIASQEFLEQSMYALKEEYYIKLYRIKNKPYFASFLFEEKDGTRYSVYLGLTYLKDEDYGNIIYDWRAPISSMFYDFEVGKSFYDAPMGRIEGEILRKRQYKIEDNKLLSAFDNSLNIDDELLQQVLAEDSDDKMKNIVNTIQKEQNNVIRNTSDKTLIVSGIAGSGKTSVALHRIAYLLYKIEKLTSNDILIFSPNQIFTEYISNVLPELGEANTLQTTFNDYLNNQIDEFNNVESFMDFLGKYYTSKIDNYDLIKYKQSDEIINDIDNYIKDFISSARVLNDFNETDKFTVDKNDVNSMIHDRYSNLPFFERIEEIAERYSMQNYKGSSKKHPTYRRLIFQNSNIERDLKEIYINFFSSDYAKYRMNDQEIRAFRKTSTINYEDALLFAYMKGLLCGFPYERDIKQVVIDEAQDYSYLEYIMIHKIFHNASFTILGDVNQTINPYYKYNSLEDLSNIFEKSKYIELTKTYRSSPEIIEFTNKILGLNHVSAIRDTEHIPLIHRKDSSKLLDDINYLSNKYKSVAVITRDSKTAERLYEELKDSIKISLLKSNTEEFNKSLVVLPSYLAKGLEFDSVIAYSDKDSKYLRNEKNLLYVACTRSQHELIVYS